MRKVELLLTRDCEASYGPGRPDTFKYIVVYSTPQHGDRSVVRKVLQFENKVFSPTWYLTLVLTLILTLILSLSLLYLWP